MLLTLTTTGKATLLIVAAAFIAWALITAIWIPRRQAEFPVTLTAFLLVSTLFFFVQMGAVYWVTSTQEVEAHEVEGGGGSETTPTETTPGETTTGETTPTETDPSETTPTETTPTETEPTETGQDETTTTANGGEDDETAGKAVFASAGCGSCHALADAGSSGNVGPNLDDAKPDEELVVDRVTNGQGAMPPFKGQLSDAQIQDVAAYVSSVAG